VLLVDMNGVLLQDNKIIPAAARFKFYRKKGTSLDIEKLYKKEPRIHAWEKLRMFVLIVFELGVQDLRRRSPVLENSRILVDGDGIRSDVAGAQCMGLKTALAQTRKYNAQLLEQLSIVLDFLLEKKANL
jgi:ribonucleotide monophosphatase NagD (HAD superfamily)